MKQTFKVPFQELTDAQVTHLVNSLVDYQEKVTAATFILRSFAQDGRKGIIEGGSFSPTQEIYLGIDSADDVIAMGKHNPFWEESSPIVTYKEALDIMGVSDYTDTVN